MCARCAPQIEAGIGEAARLYQVGLRDSQFLERSLQHAIVEQRDLHGIFGRQRMSQERGYLRIDFGLFLQGSRPLDFSGQMPACGIRNGVKTAVLAETGAAVDAKRGQDDQQKKCASHIVLLSS